MADLFENTALNAQQEAWKLLLDFTAEQLYTPSAGDCLVSLDVLYREGRAQAGIDILQWPGKEFETRTDTLAASGSYIPGYFSFYEGPVLLEVVKRLQHSGLQPNCIMVDGHGLAHPRKFGLACYVGAHTGLPVIGVAKESLLPYDPNQPEGLVLLNGETVGATVQLNPIAKPVFVSAGNRISLSTAVAMVKQLGAGYRNPENMRRADAASRK
mgnify:CR=1 FL=1